MATTFTLSLWLAFRRQWSDCLEQFTSCTATRHVFCGRLKTFPMT